MPFKEIKARSRDMAPTRDARAALLRHGCSVIVEIKRNSPVFGPTGAGHSSIETLARNIEAGGAHLIACQTERLRFDGSLADMAEARAAVELPMVCRDVIVDPYQIHEARAHGADVILLIVAALDDVQLHDFEAAAIEHGTVLVVTDAGIPIISDPGLSLVAAAAVVGMLYVVALTAGIYGATGFEVTPSAIQSAGVLP